MKTPALLCLLLLPIFAFDTLRWVDEQVKAIDQNRSGVNQATLDGIHTPFLLFRTKQPAAVSSASNRGKHTNRHYSVTFNLMAIMNNSVLINNKWIKLNDSLYGYRLYAIDNDSIVLMHEKDERTVTLSKANPKIKIEVY